MIEQVKKKAEWKHLRKSVAVLFLGIFLFGILFVRLSFSFELKGDKLVKIDFRSVYQEKGAKVMIFAQDLSKNIKIQGNVDTNIVGKYKITYSYQFGFLPITKTREVQVVDREAPTLELKGKDTQKICPNKEYEEEGYTAVDNYDGDLTSQVERIITDDTIKYKVVDSSGNATIKERRIVKSDVDAPKIYLSSGEVVYVKQGSPYQEFGYTAVDTCDGDLTDQVKVTGTVDTNTIGSYELTYSVSDRQGNRQEVVRKVIVNEQKSSSPSGKPGIVYLTFDDGPSGYGSTEKILDVLKEEGVKATFFVTSNGPDAIIKREYDEGHTVALHTATHNYAKVYASVDNYFQDLLQVQERVKNITGHTSTIIRFPGGSNNTVSNKYHKGIMSILKIEVANRGFLYFDWNVDASDAWQCARAKVTDKKTCVYRNVISGLSKEKSNVVLMHDIKDYTADALRDIIHYGKEHGYVFEALTEDVQQVKFQ